MSAAGEGKTYWDIVEAQFFKNRLATAAFIPVALLALAAVFAPFLANNRPLAYHGFRKKEYAREYREWRHGVHPEIVRLDGGPLREAREAARRKLVFLAERLEPARAAEIRRREAEYDAVLALPAVGAGAAERAARLDALGNAVAAAADPAGFDPAAPPYRVGWHFPVLLDVNALNLFFLVAAAALPVGLHRMRRSALPAETRWRRLLGRTAALAALAAAGWAAFVPSVVDTADYTGLRDGRPQEEIVADAVLWPPVPYGINENHLDRIWEPPSAAFRLGTDSTGRDLLTRLIWGGRVSLSVGFIAVAIYLAIGVALGAVAGYFRGWTDFGIMRVIEVVMCIPTFYLILSVLALFGPSMVNVMLVIGVVGWTGVARLTRGEFLRLANQDFVVAARALGAPPRRVIFRHILPNALAPVLVSATFGIPDAILTESALSFLGMGITIPTPSWGGVLEQVRANFQYWWVVTFAGLAIFTTVTCFNLVGEGLRDAMDPRLRR